MACKTYDDMIDDSFTDWLRVAWGFISGLFMAIIGFFLPVKNIVHLLVFFFFIDMIFGYWAARKTRGERFSARVIWKTTMPRMIISMVLVLGAFMWDTVYEQNMVATYRIIGWFISGVLLANILQNGYRITQWDMFLGLTEMLKNKIRKKTGVDFKKEVQNENTD
jgi:phage-related holin